MEPGCEIILTDEEARMCWNIGEDRQKRNNVAGLVDCKYSWKPTEVINYQGVLGEWALRKHFGESLVPMFDTTPTRAAKDHFDSQMYGTMDIKTIVGPPDSRKPIHVWDWKLRNPAKNYCLARIHVNKGERKMPPMRGPVRIVFEGCATAQEIIELSQRHPQKNKNRTAIQYEFPHELLHGLE